MKKFLVFILVSISAYTVHSQTTDTFLTSFIKSDELLDSVAVFIREQGLPYNNSDSIAIALDISRDFYGDTTITVHTYYGKPSWIKDYLFFIENKLSVFVSTSDNNGDYFGLIDCSHAKKASTDMLKIIPKSNIARFKQKNFDIINGNLIIQRGVKDYFPEVESNCMLFFQANNPSSWVIVFRDRLKFEIINTKSGGKSIFGKWYVKDNLIYLVYKVSIDLNNGDIEHGDGFRYDFFPEVYPDCLEYINGILYDRTNYSKWFSDDVSIFYDGLLNNIQFVPMRADFTTK